jgi:putative ABC transport system permease protein
MTALIPPVRVALEALRRNPLRTFLSTLGIVMGAASLTAVLAIGDGAEAFARRMIEREGWQVVSLSPITTTRVDGIAIPVTGFPVFDVTVADRLVAAVGARATVHLSKEGTAMLPVPGDRPRALRVSARFDPAGPPDALTLASGRHITPDEARAGAPVAVIGHKLAEELKSIGRPGGVVGERLGLDVPGTATREVEVIGVLTSREFEPTLNIVVPLVGADALMLPTQTTRASALALHVPAVETVADVRKAVTEFAEANPAWAGKFTVSALGLERLDQLAQGILAFKLLMGAFTAISLLVGGVGIMNVLLASILERTREIGVRKAVGARRRDVMRQFLVESIAISSVGTAAGLLLGLGGAFGVTAIIRAQSEVQMYAAWTWQTGAIAGLAALTIGMLAGLYPAIRASRLTPLEAIQRE